VNVESVLINAGRVFMINPRCQNLLWFIQMAVYKGVMVVAAYARKKQLLMQVKMQIKCKDAGYFDIELCNTRMLKKE